MREGVLFGPDVPVPSPMISSNVCAVNLPHAPRGLNLPHASQRLNFAVRVPRFAFVTLTAVFGVACFAPEELMMPQDNHSGTEDGDPPSCEQGVESCSCYPNGTCNDALQCVSKVCVDLGSTSGHTSTSGVNQMGVSDDATIDTGTETVDSSATGAGDSDSGAADTGFSDTGPFDTGTSDTSPSDTGVSDTGTSDTGISDTGGA